MENIHHSISGNVTNTVSGGSSSLEAPPIPEAMPSQFDTQMQSVLSVLAQQVNVQQTDLGGRDSPLIVHQTPPGMSATPLPTQGGAQNVQQYIPQTVVMKIPANPSQCNTSNTQGPPYGIQPSGIHEAHISTQAVVPQGNVGSGALGNQQGSVQILPINSPQTGFNLQTVHQGNMTGGTILQQQGQVLTTFPQMASILSGPAQQSGLQTTLLPFGVPQTSTTQTILQTSNANFSSSVPSMQPIAIQQIGGQYASAVPSIVRTVDKPEPNLHGNPTGVVQLSGNQLAPQRTPLRTGTSILRNRHVPSPVGTVAPRTQLVRTTDGKILTLMPSTFPPETAVSNQNVVSNSSIPQSTNVAFDTQTSNISQIGNLSSAVQSTIGSLNVPGQSLGTQQMASDQFITQRIPTVYGASQTYSNQRIPSPVGTPAPRMPLIKVVDGKNLLVLPTTSVNNSNTVSNSSVLQSTNAPLNAVTGCTSEAAPRIRTLQRTIGGIGAVSNGKMLSEVPSDKQPSALRNLLKESSSTTLTGTVPSSLYTNPFLSRQEDPASQQRAQSVHKSKVRQERNNSETIPVNDSPTPNEDGSFEIKFEDDGYAILIPQKNKEQDRNTTIAVVNNEKIANNTGTDSVEKCSDSPSDDDGEFDLKIDLSRLEDITKELDQLNNLGRNIEQSKELELIQQEQTVDCKDLEPEKCQGRKGSITNDMNRTEESVKDFELQNMKVQNADTEQEQKQSKELELIQLEQKKERNRELEIIAMEQEKEQCNMSENIEPLQGKEIISERRKEWNENIDLIAREQFTEPNNEVERKTPEERANDEAPSVQHSIDLSGLYQQKEPIKDIVRRTLLNRVRLSLNEKPGFYTEVLNDPSDLLSRAEILTLKNIGKTLKSIVEGLEQEVTQLGMKYGDEIYFETLKLTTHFKTDIIPKLNKIQKDEQGMETQVLLVMLKDKLYSIDPKLKDKLCNTRDSLKVLLPEPRVAMAVEDVLTAFENKYLDVVFNNESLRYAACALLFRIRQMLACHLYWFDTPKADGSDFQLLYSLRKLIFFHISEFIKEMSPDLLDNEVRDIHSLSKICSERRHLHRTIDYCLDRYSLGKYGLFFKTVREILQDIRQKLPVRSLSNGILLPLFIDIT